MLPNLLIIGAGKSGTTSLHQYLSLHPEIEMSWPKELQFFTREDWRERVDWYASRFSDDARIRGESSPAYTMYPHQPSVAERAHELIPDAKLIYMVGDPLQRAVAHYVEWRALRLDDRPIDAAFADVDDPHNPFLCASRYATQLDRYLRFFAAAQILVLDQLDLRERRNETLAEAFEFLGVDPAFRAPEFEREHNVAAEKVRYNRLGMWFMKHQILTVKGGAFRRGPLIAPLRRLLARPIDRELSPDLRERVVAALLPEVRRLRELTGRRFDRWPSLAIAGEQVPPDAAQAPAEDRVSHQRRLDA